MRSTLLGVALALTLLTAGCDGGDEDTNTKSPKESAAPSANAPAEPDVDALLKAFAKDALAVDRSSTVIPPGFRGQAFENTLFHEETRIAGLGTLYMPSALTVRYPKLANRQQARPFLRLFEEHGFGTGLTYDVDDFLHGTVQRSNELRCRLELGSQFTWLRCVPMEFFDLVEWDVANAITSLYSEETDSTSIDGWEVLYPHAYGSEPPVGAILRTASRGPHDEFRAYLYRDDDWELVAQAGSYSAIGREFGKFVCGLDARGSFPTICPAESV